MDDHEEVLAVDRMGMPVMEPKAESIPLLPLEKRDDPRSPISIYGMANITLDRSESIQQLEDLVNSNLSAFPALAAQ